MAAATNHSHNHDHCLRDALASAAELCASRGARLTDSRRRVLELIWGGHSAVKAYDIIDRFAEDGRQTRPPTVYRALDFLKEQGLIHRIESLNAFVGCPHPEAGHDSHFLICDGCSVVTELDAGPVRRMLEKDAAETGFQVARQTIEVRGLCDGCAGAG